MEASGPPPPPPMPSAPPSPPLRPRGWWSRNWLWVVPTGCLGLILIGVAFVATIMFAVFGALKSSDAYKTAVARAEADPRVVDAIGQPIHEAFFILGKTEVHGGSGESDLTIPIHGPKGKATIYATAAKSSGEWHYSKLEVKVANTGQTIDLANSEPPESDDSKEKEDQDGE